MLFRVTNLKFDYQICNPFILSVIPLMNHISAYLVLCSITFWLWDSPIDRLFFLHFVGPSNPLIFNLRVLIDMGLIDPRVRSDASPPWFWRWGNNSNFRSMRHRFCIGPSVEKIGFSIICRTFFFDPFQSFGVGPTVYRTPNLSFKNWQMELRKKSIGVPLSR